MVNMVAHWEKKRVLITVRTYPTPAKKGIEVSCTGGVTDSGEWIRLFPVPYRFLEPDRRFKKYQWIDVDAIKAADDSRPESFKLNIETVKVGSKIPTTDRWRARKDVIFPLRRPSLCQIEKITEERGCPNVGHLLPSRDKAIEDQEDRPGLELRSEGDFEPATLVIWNPAKPNVREDSIRFSV